MESSPLSRAKHGSAKKDGHVRQIGAMVASCGVSLISLKRNAEHRGGFIPSGIGLRHYS